MARCRGVLGEGTSFILSILPFFDSLADGTYISHCYVATLDAKFGLSRDGRYSQREVVLLTLILS